MWLTIHIANIPYQAAPSKLNYYVHFRGEHRYLDIRFSIALLHYHDAILDTRGRIEPGTKRNKIKRRALEKANQQMGAYSELRLSDIS
jgi:hypothetical protein